jgi:hypothetical protein
MATGSPSVAIDIFATCNRQFGVVDWKRECSPHASLLTDFVATIWSKGTVLGLRRPTLAYSKHVRIGWLSEAVVWFAEHPILAISIDSGKSSRIGPKSSLLRVNVVALRDVALLVRKCVDLVRQWHWLRLRAGDSYTVWVCLV